MKATIEIVEDEKGLLTITMQNDGPSRAASVASEMLIVLGEMNARGESDGDGGDVFENRDLGVFVGSDSSGS
jgi:hypothetical protein